MADYVFTASALIAVLLCIIPGIFHIQTRNWGAILMTFWVIATNVILFINSILWANDLDDKAPIYCLISSPIYVGSNFGLLSSITCMIHTLYSYVSNPVILTERVRKRQAVRILSITILVPTIFVGLYYLLQTNKYGIRPILGCFSPAHTDWQFFLLDGIWPVIIATIGSYYAARTSYSIVKKRLEIKSLLTYTESGLSTNKFYRLVLFCITFLLFSFPASVIVLFSNIATADGKVEDLLHKNFNRVTRHESGLAFFDYAKPLTGFFVFIFFGTGQDAMNTYKKWGRAIHLDSFIPCFREKPDEFSPTGSLRSFQNSSSSQIPKSPIVYNSNKLSLGDIKLSIPGEIIPAKHKSNNFLFLNGHRTPTEQAHFDLSSGINFSGLDDYLLGHDSKRFSIYQMDVDSKKFSIYQPDFDSKRFSIYQTNVDSKNFSIYQPDVDSKKLSIYQTDMDFKKKSYETFEGNTSTLIATSNSFSTISDYKTIQNDITYSSHVQVVPPSPRNSISINNINGIIQPSTANGINDL
ncbi:STE3-domain-containing protein [Gigaspora margarita]|uniref:STE3-domain-containing protein n=1 Tax=Gigaspora margarita TaxID=4874 RepID=A0A8H4ASK0_GIGMA|nr:STE3-domain-containing protein [Gigaspora margarita]